MSQRHRTRRILLRTVAAILIICLAGAAVGFIYVRSRLTASLPVLAGEVFLTGLTAPVTVERDSSGTATITAETDVDEARALGFIHAQERFFQMDLQRRRAAGELAELFGPEALPVDREVRVHRFRARARNNVASSPGADRQLLEAYAAGVNAGMAALDAPPFEYLVTSNQPASWRPEDTLLTNFAMYLTLQDSSGSRESMVGLVHDLLPTPLAAFLTPPGTGWDAPVEGAPYRTPPVPGPDVYDLRKRDGSAAASGAAPFVTTQAGSNNWAIAGRQTKHGGAILANDMHLGHGVPNIWYRASFSRVGEDGASKRLTGVTLPGIPALIVGSNEEIAWGFTNSQGDWSDLIVLEGDSSADTYLTPEGKRPFVRKTETIRVKGAADETLEIEETIWGPVIDRDHEGRRRVLRWVAHDPRGTNLRLTELGRAANVEQALGVATRAGIPGQNLVVADANGDIGWTIIGPIPRRVGYSGRTPTSWSDGSRGWRGWLKPHEYPRVSRPEGGRIWTANARVVDGEKLARIGHGGYALGARARQIRDELDSLDKATERDMLKVQLDDRALFLKRWRQLIVRVVTKEVVRSTPGLNRLRQEARRWGERAATDSVGYRIVREFHDTLARRVFDAITAECKQADPRFDFARIGRQSEDALWALVDQRPLHLLNPLYRSWDEQLIAVVAEVYEQLLEPGADIGRRTWGERNTASIRHPLSRFIPLVGGRLDMPATPLPGDTDMPRVQTPEFGASERMAVSPGREDEGYFHMPGGQSGHPLSPYYGAGHDAWASGEPTPFLPGPTEKTLRLVPSCPETRSKPSSG